MPLHKPKPKLQNHTKTSIKMVVPLMLLTVVTGVALVFSSFAASVYPSSYMSNLYGQAYGRSMDPSGAKHWQSYFQANGCNATTLANAAKTVYTGSEFAGKSYTNDSVVNRIYGGALQRAADPAGLKYWSGKLSSGSSRATVASGIINGGAGEISKIATSACAAPKPATPTATPAPTPAPSKPKATTPSKPKATTPASQPQSTPSEPAEPTDTEKPGKPGDFKAEVDNDSSMISLTWEDATDNEGVASYKLERSTDGQTWTVLDDTITESTYDDRTVVFSTTYKYRLAAVDSSGNIGEAVTAEAKTGEFNANANADDATAIASEDNVVIASLPAGAVPDESSCTVDLDSDDITELKSTIGAKAQRLAGPYLVSCKDSNGDVVPSFSKPVVVTMAPPKAATKGNTNFKVYIYDMQAEQWSLAKSSYDKKTKTYKVSIDGPAQVAFTGEKAANYWPLFFSIVIPTLLVGGGAFWYYQQKLKKQQYADYIKKKYYNL